jgi:hypothetical protein
MMYYFVYEIATGRIVQGQNFAFEEVPLGYSMVQSDRAPDLQREIYSQELGLIPRPDLAEFEHQRTLARIRSRRNRLLANSDWTQLPDTDLTAEQRTAWSTYRQELRDITESLPDDAFFDWNDQEITWPSRP